MPKGTGRLFLAGETVHYNALKKSLDFTLKQRKEENGVWCLFIDQTLVSDSQNNVATVIAGKTEDPNKTQRSLEVVQDVPVTNTRPDTRETVRLETDGAQGFLERPVYKPITGILESLFRPTPLVDGIKEQEKYGNSGDKFIGIGRALVNSFEGFSNFLNAVVDLPRNAAKTTSRGITEALNHVGARLIGLE